MLKKKVHCTNIKEFVTCHPAQSIVFETTGNLTTVLRMVGEEITSRGILYTSILQILQEKITTLINKEQAVHVLHLYCLHK